MTDFSGIIPFLYDDQNNLNAIHHRTHEQKQATIIDVFDREISSSLTYLSFVKGLANSLD